jgi:DNA repair exonuclease SbcCD ATPase subunit
MDRSNRLAFGAALPRMLAASGFSQSFVISHARDAEAAFPARVEVVHDGVTSSVKST